MAHSDPPSDDDDRLFEDAMRDVVPLPPANRIAPHRPPPVPRWPPPVPRPAQAEPDRRDDADLPPAERPDPPVPPTGDKLEYLRDGLRKTVLSDLRKRQYSMKSTLDLHGRNVSEARVDLEKFIATNCAAGHRYVRIIHGKGLHSRDSQSVLKPWLNYWLRGYDDVLAFCPAPSTDGGAGAVYVRIKHPDDI